MAPSGCAGAGAGGSGSGVRRRLRGQEVRAVKVSANQPRRDMILIICMGVPQDRK